MLRASNWKLIFKKNRNNTIPSSALFRSKKKNIQTALSKERNKIIYCKEKKSSLIFPLRTFYFSSIPFLIPIPGILSRFTTYLTYKPNLERKIRTGSPIGPGSPLAPFSPCNVKKRPNENIPIPRCKHVSSRWCHTIWCNVYISTTIHVWKYT